ncbi:MAG TPA: Ig-like domain repeat protein [Jatrophihabitans sp.]|jgi:hypothetical protein
MKIRTTAAVLSIAALAASMTLTAASVSAIPLYDTAPVNAGVAWLNAQTADGPLQSKSSQYGNYDNIGATIDTALTLDAITGSVPSRLTADIADGVQTGGYADADEYDFNPPYALVQHGIYANATAKALAFAVLAGEDPTAFGGEDLIAQLEGTIQPSGRIQDDSSYGDYANVYGQAFAVNGLYGADEATAVSETLGFLGTQQCSAGYFPENFGDPYSPDYTLDATCDAKGLTADVDATATVVLELQPLVATNTTAAGVVTAATTWLADTQAADGSWDGNANSTGLAGWALGESGQTPAAEKAAEWVRGRQLANVGACAPFTADAGALALDNDGFVAAEDGISDDEYNSYAVATAQALPVLRWLPIAASSPAISGPSGYVQGGTSATYQVSGFEPQTRACVTQGATTSLVATDGSGAATLHLSLPSSTGISTVTVSDGTTSSSVDTSVLAAATLTVTPSATTAVGGSPLVITVSGLANAEAVSVTFQGQTYSGTASASGTFTTPSITVSSAPGAGPITAVGQFANRTGSASIVVAKMSSTAAVSKVAPAKPTTAARPTVTVTITSTGSSDGGEVAASTGGKAIAGATVHAGKAVLTLPKLAAGKHTITFTFSGTATVAGSSTTYKVTVAKVASTLKVTKRPAAVHPNTRAKLTVTVKAKGATVNGAKVTAVDGKSKKRASGTVRNGKVVITLPKLKRGRHTITVTYPGTATAAAKSSKIVINVR